MGDAGVLAADVCPAAVPTLPLLVVGPEVRVEDLLPEHHGQRQRDKKVTQNALFIFILTFFLYFNFIISFVFYFIYF